MLLFTLFQAMNIQTIALFIPKGFKIPENTKNQVEIYAIIVTVLLMIFNYHFLIKAIPELTLKYKSEDKSQWNKRLILLSLYLLISILSIYLASTRITNSNSL